MKNDNNVSIALAKSLNEVGFPQPRPDFGQLWLSPSDKEYCFVEESAGGFILISKDGILEAKDMKHWVYVPNTADIMSQPEMNGLCIHEMDNVWNVREVGGMSKRLALGAFCADTCGNAYLKKVSGV